MRIPSTLLAAILLAGCGAQSAAQKSIASLASSAPGFLDDAVLSARVEAALVGADASSAVYVTISSHAGDVALGGKVRSQQIAIRFQRAAASVGGVRHVTSQLTIDPSLHTPAQQVSDFGLAARVRADLLAQAGVNGLQVGVRAHGATVTLTGSVASDALRTTILSTARRTPGVSRVIDELTVHPG
jgi:osmotically-inducible protein OsmY